MEQRVKVLAAHDHRTMPIGKGRVYEEGDEALAEFKLNLDSATAREWHAALKFDLADGHPLQDWSYGFKVLDAGFEERDGARIRVLKRLAVHEISPVVLGAGVGTRTVAMKAKADPSAEGLGPKLEAGRLLAAFSASLCGIGKRP